MKQQSRGLRTAVIVLLLILLNAGIVIWRWVTQPLPLAGPSVTVLIETGTLPRAIAQRWVASGVQTDPRLLYAWFRFSGQASAIRAGSYELTSGMSAYDLLDMMVRGDVQMNSVRFVEGWTFTQLRAHLAQAPRLQHTTANMSEAEIMAALGQAGTAAEGQFFPDTYSYNAGSDDLAVLRRAHLAMREHLQAAWAQRAAESPLQTPEDTLILASIVEKETGRPSDRGLVAAVFLNRLRIGMPLQTDPTVIYGLGPSFDGNLRKRDLQTDTPYNTYVRTGLPPTPIAMPGLASLLATVQPASSKALYFVARGDGTSHFSETLSEHNRAVDRYQRRIGARQ